MNKSDLMRVQLNRSGTAPFLEMFGRFMFNFGLIEALSVFYVGNFTTDELLVNQALKMQLRQRVELIRQMADRLELSKSKRKILDALWEDVLRLAEDRNHLAHNPLMFGWRGKEVGPPDFVGIPNLKKLKGYGDQPVRLMTFDQLRKKVDECSETARQLHEMLDECLARQLAGKPGGAAPAA
jgi:hypothetical protein